MKTDKWEALFETLERRIPKTQDIFDFVFKLDPKKFASLVEELRLLVPVSTYEEEKSWSPYSFIANRRLSGFDDLSSIRQKKAAAASLAHFAALYSDRIYVLAPFGVGERPVPDPGRYGGERLAEEICVLTFLRPLLEEQIIRVVSPEIAIPTAITMESITAEAPRVAGMAEKMLFDRYSSDVEFRVTYFPKQDICATITEGPLDLIQNPSVRGDKGAIISYGRGAPRAIRSLRKRKKFTTKVDVSHPSFKELFTDLVAPIICDHLFVTTCSTIQKLNYLADRDLEVKILTNDTDESRQAGNRALLSEFSHELPLMITSSIPKLLKLRKDSWDPFLVYRDSLRKALRIVERSGSEESASIFADVVGPAINELRSLVKRHRKAHLESAARKLLFGSGVAAIGLWTGFVSHEIADAVAKLGGLKYGIDTLTELNSAFVEPQAAREHPYYFLWKASQL